MPINIHDMTRATMCKTFAVKGLVVVLLVVSLALLPLETLANSDNLVYINDEVYLESYIEEHPTVVDRSTATTTKVLTKSYQERFFDIYSNYETFKKETAIWTRSQQGRRTLTQMKYVICPVWFADEVNIPANVTKMATVMQLTKEFYNRMSWNQHEITWEFLADLKLVNLTASQNATRNQGSDACLQHMASLGYVYPDTYTGLIVAYNPTANGDFSFRGGVGIINGKIIWNSLAFDYSVNRHEIGHNYGHPHHYAYSYDWRYKRDFTTAVNDGYDMMSGGNSGKVEAHLTAASKFFFNWITKDAVITMHPDGSTASCLLCVESIAKIVIKPFDRADILPSESNLMAVQIPVLGIGSSSTYSYWLSYRSNYTDSRDGLSMHLIRHNLGGMFGTTFDSLSVDADGTTISTKDSFVRNGTCYVIQPPAVLLDIDPASAEKVQPVVCVNDIIKGESITVSVSFLDSNVPRIAFETTNPLMCKKGGIDYGETTLDLMKSKVHLVELLGSGLDGNMTFSICQESTTGFVNAYFYDSYPYAYLSYNAPPSYGAFLNVNASIGCINKNVKEYKSEYGQTYVLIVADDQTPVDTIVRYTASCKFDTCHAGQYLDETTGVCINCPLGFVSAAGSVSADSCLSCLVDGLEPLGPKSKDCKVSATADPALNTGNSWRIIIPKEHTYANTVSIEEIELYALDDCSAASKISTTGGIAFSSHPSSLEAEKAFNNVVGRWGGRMDSRDLFYLGITLNRTVTVNCIIYKQPSLQTKELRVQAKVTGEENWKNVWIARYIPDITAVIPFVVVPTSAPTFVPTVTQTLEPIRTPNKSPQPMPSTSTTNSPILGPTITNEEICSSAENVCRGGLFRFFQNGETMHRTFLGRCSERCSTATLFRGFMSIFGWKCGTCPLEQN